MLLHGCRDPKYQEFVTTLNGRSGSISKRAASIVNNAAYNIANRDTMLAAGAPKVLAAYRETLPVDNKRERMAVLGAIASITGNVRLISRLSSRIRCHAHRCLLFGISAVAGEHWHGAAAALAHMRQIGVGPAYSACPVLCCADEDSTVRTMFRSSDCARLAGACTWSGACRTRS